eukprot:356804-Amphidinium_carterae.1
MERRVLFETLDLPNPDDYPWPGSAVRDDPDHENEDPTQGPMSWWNWDFYCCVQTEYRCLKLPPEGKYTLSLTADLTEVVLLVAEVLSLPLLFLHLTESPLVVYYLAAVAASEADVTAVAAECRVASMVMPLAAVAASEAEVKLVEAAADTLILSAMEDDRLSPFATTTNCVSRSLRLRLRAVTPLPN